MARRFVLYCKELAEKRSTYLFLPIVARIDRHQSNGEGGDDELNGMLDESTARQEDGPHAAMARAAFALAPQAKERAAFASMLVGSQLLERDYKAHLKAVSQRLRQIARAAPGEPVDGVSDDSASVIDRISEQAPWIWLEALVVVDNWIVGPQWFDKAFEVELRRVSL